MGYVWFLCLRMQWVMSGFCALGCNGLCLVFVPDIYMCNCVMCMYGTVFASTPTVTGSGVMAEFAEFQNNFG